MKYTQNIEVEALQFTEDNIDEILDFICDGEPFEMCFVEDRETTKLDIIKKQKLYIEHPVGMITAYFGNYLVKISKNIFQVWSKEEFEKFHRGKDRLQEIWERQQNFDNTAFQNAKTTREDTTLHRKVALITEIGELYNELPDFKYWKKNKTTEIADTAKEEFADVLHFVISLGIDIFRDEQEMFEWYCKKNDKNLERQRNGY